MTVQINEPGRHHEARHVEVSLGAGQGVTDLRDLAAGDRDILHRIQAGFGIDHAPAAQHDVRLAHGRLLCHGPEEVSGAADPYRDILARIFSGLLAPGRPSD